MTMEPSIHDLQYVHEDNDSRSSNGKSLSTTHRTRNTGGGGLPLSNFLQANAAHHNTTSARTGNANATATVGRKQASTWQAFGRQTSSISSHSNQDHDESNSLVVLPPTISVSGSTSASASANGSTTTMPLTTRSLGSQTKGTSRFQQWRRKQNLPDLPPPSKSSIASSITSQINPPGPLSLSSRDNGSCEVEVELDKLEDLLFSNADGGNGGSGLQQHVGTEHHHHLDKEEESKETTFVQEEPWLEYPQPVVNSKLEDDRKAIFALPFEYHGSDHEALLSSPLPPLHSSLHVSSSSVDSSSSVVCGGVGGGGGGGGSDRGKRSGLDDRHSDGARSTSDLSNYEALVTNGNRVGSKLIMKRASSTETFLTEEVNDMIAPEFLSILRPKAHQSDESSTHTTRVSFLPQYKQGNENPALLPSSSSSSTQQQQQQPPQQQQPYNTSLQPHKSPPESSLTSICTYCSKYCFCLPHVQKPAMIRCSSAIVRYAPCFWCCGALELSATDRKILTRLNTLLAIVALIQVGVGVGVLIVFLNYEEPEAKTSRQSYYREALSPNLWMPLGNLILLSMVGFGILIAMVISLRGIRDMSYPVLIRTMWAIYWCLPLELIFVLALFDYYRVTSVWIKHWWSARSMGWFRRVFCRAGTADTTCAIPYFQSDDILANDWCIDKYTSTDCQDLRSDATAKMAKMSYIFIYINFAIGFTLIVLLLCSLGLLESIISGPIVRESKESRIHFWLTLPGLGCLAAGFVLYYSPESVLSWESDVSIKWISVCFIISGSLFLASALLGWYISVKEVLMDRNKVQKQFAIIGFMLMLVLTFVFVVGVIVLSVILNVDLGATELKSDQRGTIACFLDAAESCSNCNHTDDSDGSVTFNPNEEQCPEWTRSDVSTIVQTQLKQSAILAFIFAFYAITALKFGITLRKKLLQYEIAYL